MANHHVEPAPTFFHLISRFTAGEFFVKEERERKVYLDLLGDALKQTDWKCLAYAVMSSHIHLGVLAGKAPRDKWLRNAHSPFGAWMNACRDRFGAVFAKPIKEFAVADEDIARVIAYIHNNPVRAGVAARADESTWTSHRAYLGMVRRPRWLCVEQGLARMGLEDPQDFDRFVAAQATRPAEKRRRRRRR